MKTFTSGLEQYEHQLDVKLRREYNKNHHAKKEDHHHETFHGISYSEYQCLKLGGYRSDDRPYGNANNRHWRVSTGNAFTSFDTLSFHEAMAKVAEGLEVREYNAKGLLEIVYRPRPETVKMCKGAGIAMVYGN